MVRNLLGSLLALVAAAAAAWSPFQHWYGARPGRTYLLGDLFGGLTGSQAALWSGLFVPLLAAAVLVLLAVLLRSRLLVAFSGLVVLGFTVLWLVQQSFESGPFTAAGGALGPGVGLALGAGVLLLVAAMIMRGRRPSGRRRKGRGSRLDEEHRHEDRLPESRLHEDRTAALHSDDDTEFPLPQDELSPPHRSYQADAPYGRRSPYGDGEYGGGGGYRGGGGYSDDDGDGRPHTGAEWDPWSRPSRSRADASGPSGPQRIPRRPDDRGPYGR